MGYASQSCYVENEILTASPERLVQILYDLATKSLAAARECNRAMDIMGRVRHINKAIAILVELNDGLDIEAGKDIAVNYARLYEYCRRRLIEANVKQSDEILAEVQSLIGELREAWQVVVAKVGAERTAKLMFTDILPSEQALAGTLSCVG